jgi:hypothetical protein
LKAGALRKDILGFCIPLGLISPGVRSIIQKTKNRVKSIKKKKKQKKGDRLLFNKEKGDKLLSYILRRGFIYQAHILDIYVGV